jgi:hypothetical protein
MRNLSSMQCSQQTKELTNGAFAVAKILREQLGRLAEKEKQSNEAVRIVQTSNA